LATHSTIACLVKTKKGTSLLSRGGTIVGGLIRKKACFTFITRLTRIAPSKRGKHPNQPARRKVTTKRENNTQAITKGEQKRQKVSNTYNGFGKGQMGKGISGGTRQKAPPNGLPLFPKTTLKKKGYTKRRISRHKAKVLFSYQKVSHETLIIKVQKPTPGKIHRGRVSESRAF